jgi:Phage integrase family
MSEKKIVLVIGLEPTLIDFSHPDHASTGLRLDATKVLAGLKSSEDAYNAVEAAKLDDVNFHTLRYTFASWAVMRGVTLKELQELLGHASLTMTMRYAHLAPEHLRTAVSRLEGLASLRPALVSAQASAQEPVETVGVSQKYQ